MQKLLPILFVLFLGTQQLRAQCDAAFTYSINQNQVGFATTANSNTLKHSWLFGDGTMDFFSPDPVHSYSMPGQYTVLHSVRDSANNCIDSAWQLITLNFTPTCTVNFTYVRSSVLSGRYIFYPQVSILGSTLESIAWTINGAQASTQEVFDYTFTQPGTYTVCLNIETTSGCAAQKCYTIDYQPYTNCNTGSNFTYTPDAVQTRQINFTAQPNQPQLKYYWNFGDGYTALNRIVSHSYSRAGIYNVSLVVTDSLNYCRDSLSKSIEVIAPPSESCTASFTYLINQQGQVSYTAVSNQPIASQTWTIFSADSSNAVILNTVNPVYSFTDTGSYYVCLAVVTDFGCTATHCQIIKINSITEGRPALIASYPNPVSGEASIRLNIDMRKAGIITYKVCNLAGTIVYQTQKPGQQGNNIISIPVQQLMKGQYFIDIVLAGQHRRSVFQKL